MNSAEAKQAREEGWRVVDTSGRYGTVQPTGLGLERVRVAWERPDMPPYVEAAAIGEITRAEDD